MVLHGIEPWRLSSRAVGEAALLSVDDDDMVSSISHIGKSGLWINGGFFILKREIFDYMEQGDELVVEALADPLTGPIRLTGPARIVADLQPTEPLNGALLEAWRPRASRAAAGTPDPSRSSTSPRRCWSCSKPRTRPATS